MENKKKKRTINYTMLKFWILFVIVLYVPLSLPLYSEQIKNSIVYILLLLMGFIPLLVMFYLLVYTREVSNNDE